MDWTNKGLANTAIIQGSCLSSEPCTSRAWLPRRLNTGNYLNSSNALVTAQGVSLADSYISGRAPEFTFFNFGVERVITRDMTLAVNYAGDESHFLNTGANVRGYWSNQLNPVYLAGLGSALDSTAPASSCQASSAGGGDYIGERCQGPIDHARDQRAAVLYTGAAKRKPG